MINLFRFLLAFALQLPSNLALSSSFLPKSAATAETEDVVSYSLGCNKYNNECVKGSSYGGTVYASSLKNVSSLSVEIHFNDENLSINNINNYAACSIYDSNIGTDVVKITYLFDKIEESNRTDLFYFSFQISSSANLGSDYLDIIVSEAYDNDLNVVDFSNCRSKFDIVEQNPSTYRYIYSGISGNGSSINKIVSINYYTYAYDIQSGTFLIRYDDELFVFDSLTQGGYLANKIVDINSSNKGSVYLSFVSTSDANSPDLFTINLKTIKNVTTSTNITMNASDLCDSNLMSLTSNEIVSNIEIVKDETYTVGSPCVSLLSSLDNTNSIVTLKVALDEDTRLGAGDFVITFDKEELTYSAYSKLFSPSFFNVNTKEIENGIFKFSIINLTDIVKQTEVIKIDFAAKRYCEKNYDSSFEIVGNGITDSLTNKITLNFVGCSQFVDALGHDYAKHETTATCEAAGEVIYVCSRCGNEDASRREAVPAKGHSLTHHVRVEPTCVSGGSVEFWECSTCGKRFSNVAASEEVQSVDLPPLGHSLSHIGYEAPTCTETGHTEHYACGRCGKTFSDSSGTTEATDVSIPALGHDYAKHETPATCEAAGEVIYVCSRCGEEDASRREAVPAKGHSYGEWLTKKEATTKEEGIEERTCLSCGHTEQRTIPMLPADGGNNDLAIILGTSSGVVVAAGATTGIAIFFRKKKIRK